MSSVSNKTAPTQQVPGRDKDQLSHLEEKDHPVCLEEAEISQAARKEAQIHWTSWKGQSLAG